MMSGVIAAVHNMQSQGVNNSSAYVDRDNISSMSSLEKSGFKRIRQFDLKQDLYKI